MKSLLFDKKEFVSGYPVSDLICVLRHGFASEYYNRVQREPAPDPFLCETVQKCHQNASDGYYSCFHKAWLKGCVGLVTA